MKKSAVIILVVALFAGNAFASSACSKRATGTLFSDSTSSSGSSVKSSGTKGTR